MPIHPTAIVHPEAQVDPTASVGPYSFIEAGVSVGAGTEIGPYVHLLGATTIDQRCRIHARASIGDLPQDAAYKGSLTGCQIGDETVVREGVTIRSAGRLLAANAERHLKSPDEMELLFLDFPDAVEESLHLLGRIDFTLDELKY